MMQQRTSLLELTPPPHQINPPHGYCNARPRTGSKEEVAVEGVVQIPSTNVMFSNTLWTPTSQSFSLIIPPMSACCVDLQGVKSWVGMIEIAMLKKTKPPPNGHDIASVMFSRSASEASRSFSKLRAPRVFEAAATAHSAEMIYIQYFMVLICSYSVCRRKSWRFLIVKQKNIGKGEQYYLWERFVSRFQNKEVTFCHMSLYWVVGSRLYKTLLCWISIKAHFVPDLANDKLIRFIHAASNLYY